MNNVQAIMSIITSGNESIETINNQLLIDTGIANFFDDHEDRNGFIEFIHSLNSSESDKREREFGDFQTPLPLSKTICEYLVSQGCSPDVVIEPTFGKGHFIQSSLEAFENVKMVYGVEIQRKYIWLTKYNLAINNGRNQHARAEIILNHDNIFNHTFSASIMKDKEILVIGNPPWVTNAELSTIDSGNLPTKTNFKEHKGLDAITGKGNFDICEYIILQMIERFNGYNGTFAMLCKNSVAKNIMLQLPKKQYKISNMKLLNIDAKKEFNAATDASLFYFTFGEKSDDLVCKTYSLYEPSQARRTFGWYDNKFVSDVEQYAINKNIDNQSSLVWRSGIKHDCSKIMELDKKETLINGLKENVDVEDTLIYDLLKSSDLKGGIISSSRKSVIVTQKKIGENTAYIREYSPKLWKYLNEHRAYLDKRKSTIYVGKPDFSIFGVGDYSFAAYKVAISGMYKTPHFSLVMPVNDKPVMLDDTCYFLGFDALKDAVFTFLILNSKLVQDLLKSIVFEDEKRPYTKDVLMRIDLAKCAELLSFEGIKAEQEMFDDLNEIKYDKNEWESYCAYLAAGTKENVVVQSEMEL